MRLEDFRKIVLEPDPEVAREMSSRQRRPVSKLPPPEAARTDSPKPKKVDPISCKREKSVDNGGKSVSNASRLPSRAASVHNKSRIKSNDDAKSRISPARQKHSRQEEAAAAPSPEQSDPPATQQPSESLIHSKFIRPFCQFYAGLVAAVRIAAFLPSAILRRCKIELDATSSRLLNSPYLVVPAVLYAAGCFKMTYPLFALSRLFLGTLYPAYASYKAVRTKNVREYVKWMMYWIVFALFSCFETFADIFVAFWFPFYYELKILMLLWLISPVSRGSLGSSIIYRKFVHPLLMKKEEEIDHMILRLQEQGYNTVTRLAGRVFRSVSDFVMQTAIRHGPDLAAIFNEVDGRGRQQPLHRDGGGFQHNQMMLVVHGGPGFDADDDNYDAVDGADANMDDFDQMIVDAEAAAAAAAAAVNPVPGTSRSGRPNAGPVQKNAAAADRKTYDFSSDSEPEATVGRVTDDDGGDADFEPSLTARKARGRPARPKSDPVDGGQSKQAKQPRKKSVGRKKSK